MRPEASYHLKRLVAWSGGPKGRAKEPELEPQGARNEPQATRNAPQGARNERGKRLPMRPEASYHLKRLVAWSGGPKGRPKEPEMEPQGVRNEPQATRNEPQGAKNERGNRLWMRL